MSFKPIAAIHNRAIDKLVTQIEQQKKLLMAVKSVLPENLAEHTTHCVLHDTTLVVYSDAPVWSSQLRFYQRAILAAIQPIISEPIKTIQIHLSRG